MKTIQGTRIRGACILLLAAVSSHALAEGDSTLEYREFKTIADNPLPLVAKWISSNEGHPEGLPTTLHKAGTYSFTVHVADQKVLLATSMAAKAKVYVDFDGDGDFSGAKVLPRPSKKAKYWYGPVVVPIDGTNGRLAARFNVGKGRPGIKDKNIILNPAGCRTGTVQLGMVSYKVALVDANFNGRYDDVCTEFDGDYGRLDADCFAIDLDHDKQFDLYRETCPLTERLWVRGVYYSLRVVPDGSKVRLQRVKPEFKLGALDVGNRDIELVVFSPDLGVPVVLKGSDGTWKLPAGTYTICHYQLCRVDGKGEWTLEHRPKSEEMHTYVFIDERHYSRITRRLKGEKKLRFTVSPGETQKLKIGSPLRIVTQAKLKMFNDEESTVLITCRFLGQAGEEYEQAVTRSGRRRPPPMLRILDEKGKMLAADYFGSVTGIDEPTGYMWEVSRQFKDKFRVEVIPDIGPFEVMQDEQWRTVPREF
jgi:hypothetical protein